MKRNYRYVSDEDLTIQPYAPICPLVFSNSAKLMCNFELAARGINKKTTQCLFSSQTEDKGQTL